MNNSKSNYEKRQKRRNIRALQDAITENNIDGVRQILESEFDVDFQYRGQTALQQAVKGGSYEVCTLLIERGADVNKSDAEKNSLLNMAVWRGHQEIVNLLLKNNADIDSKNEHGSTPLNSCAYKGFADIAKDLLKASCDPNLANDSGHTPLHTAVKQNFQSVVAILLEFGAVVNQSDFEHKTPLFVAASLGHLDIVNALLSNDADPNVQDRMGRTPLFEAAVGDYVEISRKLIAAGADVDLPTTKGFTPLLASIDKDHFDVAVLLIDSNCDFNKADRLQQAPIHVAVRQASQYFSPKTESAISVVQKLVHTGCDINVGDGQGWRPLYQSAFGGNAEISRLLLDSKADLSVLTKLEETVLHGSVYGNKPDIVDMLIKAGCDVNQRNKAGEHPLLSAVASRADIKIIKSLIDAGSDLDLREFSQKLSALHQAIIQHYDIAAKLLVESGCNVNILNVRHQSPLYLACERGNEVVVSHLLAHPKISMVTVRQSAIPLHVATVTNHPKIVVMLIEAGCNINEMNDNSLTPIQAAAQEDQTAVAKILLKYGCDLNAHAKVKCLMKCCLLHEDAHPHFDLEPLFLALTHKNIELLQLFIKCYHSIPADVIKKLVNIFQISTELRAHYSTSLKKDITKLFLQTLRFPRMLQESCRAVIRECLGSRPEMKTEKLPLAKKLEDYVLMKSVFLAEDEDDDNRRMGAAEKIRRGIFF